VFPRSGHAAALAGGFANEFAVGVAAFFAVCAIIGGVSAAFSHSVASGTRSVRYSSAQQVVAALNHGGLPRAGGSTNTPVVSGASSETLCDFTSSQQVLIDVFPGTVSTATLLDNSVSTGTQKIWSDVGPNWWVQTSSAYANRVRAILGGRIVGGPWHPAQPSQQSASSSSSPSPSPSPSSSPPPSPTPAPAKPQIIAEYSGKGIQNTPAFTTPATWHLSWWYSCASFGNFIVTEGNTDGTPEFNGVSVNELGTGRGPVATYAYGDAGQHYLSINSECDWQAAVVSGGG
jgi:hypothetical protein